MSKPKTIIHEFDPVVYPVKLWVTIAPDLDELSERFVYYPSGDKIETKEADIFVAFTYRVKNRQTGHLGILVSFVSKKYCTVKNLTHEATHAARDIWKHLGENETGTEADAYLVGWIAECIEKVKLNKE